MKLVDWMTEAGVDDDKLAALTKTDRTTISRLRRGKQRPSWSLAKKLAEVTAGKVTADSFLNVSVEAAE